MKREWNVIRHELLERLAPEDPMNQDEQGGCVWCDGTPPRDPYCQAGRYLTDHAPDCPWVAARQIIGDRLRDERRPEDVPCPTCRSGVGEPCVSMVKSDHDRVLEHAQPGPEATMSCDGSGFVGTITHLVNKGDDFTVPLRCRGCPNCVPPLKPGSPAVCPNGHAMDDGLFECPACGAYRPSAAV